jgi:hypothetical protein
MIEDGDNMRLLLRSYISGWEEMFRKTPSRKEGHVLAGKRSFGTHGGYLGIR